MVFQQAMAAGVPVVGTRVGGVEWIVGRGGGGILVEPNHPAAFADALRTLLANPAMAFAMGARGRIAAASRFAAERVADRTVGLYEAVLAGASSRSPRRARMTRRLVGGFGTLAGEAVRLAVGRGAGKLLSFLAFLVVARALGPARYGGFTFALSLGSLLVFIPNLGVDPLFSREVPAGRAHPGEMLGVMLMLKVCAGVAFLVAYWGIVFFSPAGASARAAALFIGPALFLLAVGQTWRTVLVTSGRAGWAGILEVIAPAIFLGLSIALIASGLTVSRAARRVSGRPVGGWHTRTGRGHPARSARSTASDVGSVPARIQNGSAAHADLVPDGSVFAGRHGRALLSPRRRPDRAVWRVISVGRWSFNGGHGGCVRLAPAARRSLARGSGGSGGTSGHVRSGLC